MQRGNWIAWLYWNPPREAFTIPWLDHPIVWYGILFVTGFILGYFLIIPILSRFLCQTKQLSKLDILDWPLLIDSLKTASPLSTTTSPIQRFLDKLPSHRRKQLEQLLLSEQSKSALQTGILDSLNALLSEGHVQRRDIEQAFPKAMATAKQTSYLLADRLCWFIVIGTLVGARLGAVFFYDWPYFKQHPLEMIQVWKGGLASHGGVIGVMMALYLYTFYMRRWIPQLTFLKLLDFVSIPSALAACFIRLGNFMNQEILGTPTNLPWGVVFGQPADGSLPIPRHPIQLYEALAYLMLFFFLYWLWKTRGSQLAPGTLTGTLFALAFTSRFILEFWKAQQESILNDFPLQMGQLLSIPFALFGFFLIMGGMTKGRCFRITSTHHSPN